MGLVNEAFSGDVVITMRKYASLAMQPDAPTGKGRWAL